MPSASAPEQIRLKKLNMADAVKPGRIIVAIGKRGSGKSVLIRDILYNLRNTPQAIAMSPTEPGNGFYGGRNGVGGLLPPCFVYSDYEPGVIDNILAHQIKMAKKGQASPIVLVLDDCMFDATKIFKQSSIKSIFLNGRHYLITLILGCQYSLNLPPWARAQIDVVFAMREPIHSNRERLFTMFFGSFPSMSAFGATLDACTSDFECLVSNNAIQSNELSDCCFYYKAPLHTDAQGRPNFRVGAPSMWKYYEQQLAKAAEDKKARRERPKVTAAAGVVITKLDSATSTKKQGPKRVLKLG